MFQGMLPPEAQDHERVRAQLTWALNAMNSAMEGVPLQYAQPQQQPAVGAGYAYAGNAGVYATPLSEHTNKVGLCATATSCWAGWA